MMSYNSSHEMLNLSGSKVLLASIVLLLIGSIYYKKRVQYMVRCLDHISPLSGLSIVAIERKISLSVNVTAASLLQQGYIRNGHLQSTW